MLDITRRSAEFVAGINSADLPDRCVEAAKIGFVDCVGVMIAGAGEEPVRIVSAMAPTVLQNDATPEIPSGRKASSTWPRFDVRHRPSTPFS